MKKIVFSSLIVLVLFVGCSNDTDSISDPVYSVNNQLSKSVWVALGLYDGTSYTLSSSSWVEVHEESMSTELSIVEGDYFVLYDWDSDHSDIQTPILERTYIFDTKYLFTFTISNTLIISEY